MLAVTKKDAIDLATKLRDYFPIGTCEWAHLNSFVIRLGCKEIRKWAKLEFKE